MADVQISAGVALRNYLKGAGFMMTEKCACGGTLTETWQRPGKPLVILEIKPNRNFWKIISADPNVQGHGVEVLQHFVGGLLAGHEKSITS